MKHDIVDKLLQLAYLEGAIATRRGYENSVARKTPAVVVSPEKQRSLMARLEQMLEGAKQSDTPLTVGAFLQKARTDASLQSEEIASRIGLSSNIYRMLEHDRISPLKVSVDAWRRLRVLFSISVDELAALVRRTHQLVFFRPAFRTTLARYDARKSAGKKSVTLEKAAAELYTRAKLKLPKEEMARIEKLIGEIRGG
jgi:transcriptional regulator with XRE-family HTH domain